jgi:NAD(P)H dehydrogenase (quinone)
MGQVPRVVIVYFSATGATASLAKAVASGAAGTAEVVLCEITGEHILAGSFSDDALLEAVDAASAVVFGSPTYMGGPAAQFKAFADASGGRWPAQRWAGKLAAGFTTGGSPNGDQTNTLVYFSILAAQHGMLWCGLDIPGGEDPQGRNRLGSQIGLVSQSANGLVEPSDLITASYLGNRVAALAARR